MSNAEKDWYDSLPDQVDWLEEQRDMWKDRAEKAEAEVARLREEKEWLLREALEYRKNAKELCNYAIPAEHCLDLAIKNATE